MASQGGGRGRAHYRSSDQFQNRSGNQRGNCGGSRFIPQSENPLSNLRHKFKNVWLNNVKEGDKELGRGSYGIVKEATWLGVSCATKRLHGFIVEAVESKPLKDFIRECKIWVELKHPYIVQLFGVTFFEEESPLPVLVMERMDLSLRALIDETHRHGRAMPLWKKAAVLHHVSLALVYLHGRNCIHRDVTPNNVLLCTDSWCAKLSDFGVARIVKKDGYSTASQQVAGTADFMPPENMEEDPRIDQKMDVFSVGCLAVSVLSFQWPHPGPAKRDGRAVTELERRRKYIACFTEEERRLYESLIIQCLEDNPKNRPKMADVAKKLSTICKSLDRCREPENTRDQEVSALQKDIECLQIANKELKKKAKLVSELEEEAADLREQVSNKDELISELEKEAADLYMVNDWATNKDELISRLEEEVADLREQVSNKDELVSELEEEVADLREQVSVPPKLYLQAERFYFAGNTQYIALKVSQAVGIPITSEYEDSGYLYVTAYVAYPDNEWTSISSNCVRNGEFIFGDSLKLKNLSGEENSCCLWLSIWKKENYTPTLDNSKKCIGSVKIQAPLYESYYYTYILKCEESAMEEATADAKSQLKMYVCQCAKEKCGVHIYCFVKEEDIEELFTVMRFKRADGAPGICSYSKKIVVPDDLKFRVYYKQNANAEYCTQGAISGALTGAVASMKSGGGFWGTLIGAGVGSYLGGGIGQGIASQQQKAVDQNLQIHTISIADVCTFVKKHSTHELNWTLELKSHRKSFHPHEDYY